MSKYKPVKLEKEVIKYWEDNNTYEELKKKRKKGDEFVLHDGPPYTSGVPGPHTTWNRCLKDMVRRTKWMQGYNVWDQPGFDTHGLPIEVGVEKKLGLKNKEGIEEFGVTKFIKECKKLVNDYADQMKQVFSRVGEWADWDGLYMSIKPSYMESMWWALKQAHKKGLLYQGEKVLTWCPRCGTALAGNYEVVHKDVEENSVFVKIKTSSDEYLLVWTTTPWTLPWNMAVMVHPELEYVKARVGDEKWILAKGLVNAVMGLVGEDYEIVETMKGEDLEGISYEHPFEEEVPAQKEFSQEWVHKVILSEKYVDLSAGTGLVHCAPGCGPEDYEVGKEYGIPAFNPLDEKGVFPEQAGELEGLTAKIDDRKIVEKLEEKGLLVMQSRVEHSYPHCERCKSPVIFRITDQWFLKVSKFKKDMLEANKKVKWIPEWAGSKAFKNWLENIKDWVITRQRYWGTPFPLWVCNECGKEEFIGSSQELEKKSGKKLDDLHKNVVDKVKWDCSCGGRFERHPDVVDVWIDAACTPFASVGYPYKNKKLFEKELSYIDFLTESKDQFRGWFYALMAMSTIVFDRNFYKTVYLHGFMTDMEGDFMSKRKENYMAMPKILEEYGADIYRLYVLGGSSPGVDLKFDETKMKETYRSLNVLWNLAEYLKRYASFVDYEPRGSVKGRKLKPVDKWIVSRANTLNKQVLEHVKDYSLNEIPLKIQEFYLEDLSRSYVQYIRNDLATGSDKRKETVLEVMFYVFKKILPLLAPSCPFITEKLYQDFKSWGLGEDSVHHEELPKPDKRRIKKGLEENMDEARQVMKKILSIRESEGISLRWPLKKAWTPKKLGGLKHLVQEQVNVKEVVKGKPKQKVAKDEGGKYFLNTKMTEELLGEGFARQVQRRIQGLRKKKGLRRSDKIDAIIVSDDELKKMLEPRLSDMSEVVGARTILVQEEADTSDYLTKEVTVKDKKIITGIKEVS